MKIWDINPIDHTVINSAGRDAPLDPMRGEPHIPRGATSVAPPAAGEHQAARWTGNAWELVTDWRGHVYYTTDGQRHEITEIGIEPPADAFDTAPPEPLADMAQRKRLEIDQASKAALTDLRRQYPRFEIDTWRDQESEARAWKADNTVDTPTLTGIAEERGIALADLANRVIANAEVYRPRVTKVIGKRQRLEDALDAAIAAGDREAIEAVEW